MQEHSCLIIEDEPLAAEILADYVAQVPFLVLKGTFRDALSALHFLEKNPVDLIFLDIHLPKLKGVDFLRMLAKPPKVILTTAFQEYAIEGYELNVVDYLLKPISFNRFLAAVNKVSQVVVPVPPNPLLDPQESPSILINTGRKKVKLAIEDILWVESMKEYVRISTTGRTLITKMSMIETVSKLTEFHFMRIHRSFLIPLKKVQAFSSRHVEINGKSLPIGRSYQVQVVESLGGIAG